MSAGESDAWRRFSGQEMILRDHLALDRNKLANERTFLAYLRTALTFFVAGITFIQFFDSRIAQVIGWGFLPCGFVTVALGWRSYRRFARHMRSVEGAD